jgi:hypothetical protein
MTGEQVPFGGITLSQNPAQLRYAMEQLIIHGAPMPMGNSLPPGLGSLESFRARVNQFTFAQVSEERICQQQPPDDWQCRLALKIRPILDPIIDDLERESYAQVAAFEDAAHKNTIKTLDANEKQARAELVRYGITETQVQRTRTEYTLLSAGADLWSERQVKYTETEYHMGGATSAVTGLQNAAMVLLKRREAIAKKQQEQAGHLYSGIPTAARIGLLLTGLGTMPFPDERYFELDREITEMKKGYDEFRNVLGAQYPALGAVSQLDQSPEGIRTLAAGAGPETAALVGARVGSVLDNIAKVRSGLWDDVNVWLLAPIMDLTKVERGIQPGTIQAALIDEKIKWEQPGILNSIAIAVLNIAALLLAAPTGGLSLAVMGAVNIGLAASHVQEYLMAKALHGSALDQARALSQEDPSLFWLAVEIIGVGVGDVPAVASSAFRAFRLLAPVARAAVVAKEGKQAAAALADLRLTAEEVQDAALADRLVTRVGELRGGRMTAMAAVGATEEETKLLGASVRAAETEAAQAIGQSAVAAGEGSVKLSQAGWLFSCSSPCTIIRERFAQVLGSDPARLAELAELEKRALEAATALEAARAVDPVSEAAREAERAVNSVSEDAAAFVHRLQEAHPEARLPLSGVAEDALFWSDVEPYVNKKLSEVGTPPGYTRYERDGQTFLRRTNADDALYPRLTVDGDGVIRVGPAAGGRISTPGALAKALGTRPLNHEAHHLVPDAVVQDHPLFEAARTRGSPPYDLDRASNGIYLPNTDADRIPGVTDHLPVHSGSHPQYNLLAQREADRVFNKLINEFGSLDKVPAGRLIQACTDVEDAMRVHLDDWVAAHGDSVSDF